MFKITANIQKLYELVSNTIGATKQNELTQTSNYILLTTLEDNMLSALASDNENTLYSEIEIEKSEEGSIGILADKLLEFLKTTSATDKNITITEKKDWVRCKTSSASGKIASLPSNKFVSINLDAINNSVVKIPQTILFNCLQLVLHAVGDKNRTALGGIFFKIEEDTLTIVGTDGAKLIETIYSISYKGDSQELIIDKKAGELLKRLLQKSPKEEIDIHIVDNYICFKFNGIIFTTRLYASTYPQYKMIINQYFSQQACIDKELLIKSLNIANVFTTKESAITKWIFSENMLTISSTHIQSGESVINIPIFYEGDDLTIGLNPTYITNILENIQDVDVTFYMEDKSSPVIIKNTIDDITITSAIMSMRI